MIDINCDMGEINTLLDNGTYEALMDHVTSINIACGGHAGDEEMIRAMVKTAKEKKVKIGAHPSYPDRKNFGRYEMDISDEELSTSILEQITGVMDIAAEYNYSISHIKPHGALYNKAARDKSLATLIGKVILSINPSLPIMCLAGSRMVSILKDMGLNVLRESFADRTYEADGSLRKRTLSNALIFDLQVASLQAFNISKNNKLVAHNGTEITIQSDTLCIHSDTPDALKIAIAVNNKLNRS
ncbi:5-oxoprolinase subunit PxpA [Candidatus Marinimicrobia bacterium]|nr:5-oxoprolinase subunit PxpA [Candidatus Neomarinimicrobiota bacterium]MDC0911055.1 5-oxoprolinase subunit PxpA [Candidatus Neomarinimicrobiota bacterium]